MGFFQKIFDTRKSQISREKNISVDSNDIAPQNENALKLLELKEYIATLMNADKFIAKSDYTIKISTYADIVNFFAILKSSGMLAEYCRLNGLSVQYIQEVLDLYCDIEKYIDQHNEDFIRAQMVSENEYLENLLKSIDPNISLDEDQRRVVLTDEDYCLVIAGAGAGKTTTVAAKV